MTENAFNMILINKRLEEYCGASKLDKGKILDQLEKDTGRIRKSIIRTLNSCRSKPKTSPGRPKIYDQQSLNLIRLIWEYNDFIGAERFHGSIVETLVELNSEAELNNFDKRTIELIKHIPLGTLKQKLRKLPKPRRRISHNCVSELKRQVPIRTGFKPSIVYGFLAIDFVEHTGGNASGHFARTLCAVDPKTTWISRAACLGKDRPAVEYASSIIMSKVPYKIKGMHSDNEPNLLYLTLRHQARNNKFMVSRSRPYKKEDNGHVEQKNGDKIRGLVGYSRYDQIQQVELLNQIYEVDDIFQNHFIASMRLIVKEYDELGKLTKKIYSNARTPYQRVMEDLKVPIGKKMQLCAIHKRLNRVKLKKERDQLLLKLFNFR